MTARDHEHPYSQRFRSIGGTALTIVMVLIYTNLGDSTLVVVTAVNVVLFIGIFSRMIPFQALMSQVPAQARRGSFNAITAAISQLAGGVASRVAGHIVSQGADGRIHHYDIAGYVVADSARDCGAGRWLTAPFANYPARQTAPAPPAIFIRPDADNDCFSSPGGGTRPSATRLRES